MENVYLTALHGMPKLLEIDRAMENFKRGRYSGAFEAYYRNSLSIFEALEQGYQNAIDKEQYLINMADELSSSAFEKVNAEKRRAKKDSVMMEMNLRMVVYVFPAVKQYKGEVSEPVIEALLTSWKQHFPEARISAATFQEIESGFHKKWCYITTAVCETFHKPDDCYELTLLRDYRDTYLAAQPDGPEVIREYYDVAPTIVKRIDRMDDREEIYRDIWNTYLNPCISMIQHQQMEECKELYIKMVRTLQETYFYTN